MELVSGVSDIKLVKKSSGQNENFRKLVELVSGVFDIKLEKF